MYIYNALSASLGTKITSNNSLGTKITSNKRLLGVK